MQISLSDAGKRFNRDWIFRNFTYDFKAGHSCAVIGPNGSGKSTLLQVIAGALVPSEGSISYWNNNKIIDPELAYRHLAIAAPYQEVVEEMSVSEFLAFHSKFKPFMQGFTVKRILDEVNLSAAADRQIRYFSSGMKQRVKLAQAFFSNVPCLLLDEPCTNLDVEGIALYQRLVKDYCVGRIVIVSSNDQQEYGFCEEVIDMRKLKGPQPEVKS